MTYDPSILDGLVLPVLAGVLIIDLAWQHLIRNRRD